MRSPDEDPASRSKAAPRRDRRIVRRRHRQQRAIRQLHEPARSIPAAALTAYARSQDRVTSLASGFQMHLVKPIDPLELIVAVSTLAPRRIGA